MDNRWKAAFQYFVLVGHKRKNQVIPENEFLFARAGFETSIEEELGEGFTEIRAIGITPNWPEEETSVLVVLHNSLTREGVCDDLRRVLGLRIRRESSLPNS